MKQKNALEVSFCVKSLELDTLNLYCKVHRAKMRFLNFLIKSIQLKANERNIRL